MKRVSFVCALSGLLVASANPSAAQTTINLSSPAGRQIIAGELAGGRFGTGLDRGDLDGDGNNRDLVVRSPNEVSNRGTVRIFLGWFNKSGDVGASAADITLFGAATGDRFGAASATGFVTRQELNPSETPVAPIPRDLTVGAPGALGNRGVVYVFAGPFLLGTTRTTGQAVFQILGQTGDQLGAAVRTADLNRDGYREVIASAPGSGRVYVIDVHAALVGGVATRDLTVSPADMTISGAGSGPVLATGDIHGDGIFDLAIGSPDAQSGRGAVYVIPGRNGALTPTVTLPAGAQYQFVGADPNDHAGSALWISSVDNDTISDLLITSPDADGFLNTKDSCGEAFVIWGGASLPPPTPGAPVTLTPGVTIVGAAVGNRTGAAISASDINRDNPDDIALLAPGGNGGFGEVDVVYGASRADWPVVVDLASRNDRRILSDPAVGGIADVMVWEVTSEGAEDLVISAPGATTASGANSGIVYLSMSPTMRAQPDFTIVVSESGSASAPMTIGNVSEVPISVQLGPASPFLSVPSTPVTTKASAPGSVIVTANGVGLTPGAHPATITATSLSRDLTMTSDLPLTVRVSAVRIANDGPANGATTGQRVDIVGWAIDLGAASGPGVDAIHVYAAPPGGALQFLGIATYGAARDDVAAAFGPQFRNSGYSLVSPPLAAGTYQLTVFARSALLGTFKPLAGSTFTVAPSPLMALDVPVNGTTPTPPFTVSGWAIDRAAAVGSGVDAVHIYAYPASGGAPIGLGIASYGAARSDIAAAFGSQFLNSGFSLTVASLQPGTYDIRAFARSTVAGAFIDSRANRITIPGTAPPPNGPTDPLTYVDAPGDNAIIGSSFTVSGWAIDRGAGSGAGVDAIHVYAFNPGGAATFLGVATYGLPRPDLGAFFGPQFTNSGFELQVSSLAAGTYQIVVFARSVVTNTFNAAVRSNVTVGPGGNATIFLDAPANGSSPAQPFVVSGWAVDRASASGTGIDYVHVYAMPLPTGNAFLLGAASYGESRPDVGALFGARFTPSGFRFTVTGLAPGDYRILAFAHSTVNNGVVVTAVDVRVR
jgi:FG-GAP repeat protein